MKKIYAGLLLVVHCIGLTSLSWGQCFVKTNFSVSTTPLSIAVSDFNGDGKPDLATANTFASSVSVRLNNGNGIFGSASTFNVGSDPIAVVVGDFDGDGRPDLATANETANTVSVVLNTGGGNFGPTAYFAVGIFPQSIAVGDLNGDGRLDMVTANQIGNSVSVLLNTNGSFSVATNISVTGAPSWVAVGDLNADNKLDLVTANLASATVAVLLGNGNGTFGSPTQYGVNDDPGKVLISDFNGDGKPDLATSNNFGNTVSVLMGSGNGSFSNPTRYGVGKYPSSLTKGDFTGDGISDLVTTNSDGNTISVLPGNGNGGFSSAIYFDVNTSPRSAAVGDFNNDGKPDLALNFNTTPTLSLLTNCTSAVPADLSLKQPAYDCSTGQLTLSTTGGNGQLVEYRILGLRDWATSASFTVPAYQQNGINFTLEARQSGQIVKLPFLTACSSTTASPPSTPTQPTPSGLSLGSPTYGCANGLLVLNTVGGNGTLVEYRVVGLRDWAASNSFLVPVYQQVGTSFTLEARQSGQVTSRPFVTACQSTTSIPSFTPPAPTPLIINAITASCTSIQITTGGGNGTLVEYKIPGLRDWGPSPFFTVPAYQSNGTRFTLYARQSGYETSVSYTTACSSPSRSASSEAATPFTVTVYPNPVGEQFSVGVSGATGQVVRYRLSTLNGQTVVEQRATAESDAHTETIKLPASGAGLYLLQVSTDTHSQTVKVLKP